MYNIHTYKSGRNVFFKKIQVICSNNDYDSNCKFWFLGTYQVSKGSIGAI